MYVWLVGENGTSSNRDCTNVADGYCHDENNNIECKFDGGDCCGSNVKTEYCTECQCHGDNNNN